MMMNESVSKILTERHAWAERSLQIIEMIKEICVKESKTIGQW